MPACHYLRVIHCRALGAITPGRPLCPPSAEAESSTDDTSSSTDGSSRDESLSPEGRVSSESPLFCKRRPRTPADPKDDIRLAKMESIEKARPKRNNFKVLEHIILLLLQVCFACDSFEFVTQFGFLACVVRNSRTLENL